jgi:alpha-L-rhamnosidase
LGFTFQINQDVEFNHNSTFLVEADRARPSLMTQLVSAKYLVTLNSASNKDIDPNKLIRQNIRQLTKQTFGKGQHFIIDFAQHYVGHFRINIASIGSPMDAPLYIHLRFAEIANELTDTSTGSDGWLSSSWIQEEYVHLDTLPATLELPRRYSFRF